MPIFFFADGFIANVGLSNVSRKRAAVSEARPPLDPEEADEYGSGLMFSREGHYQEAVFLASSLAASTQVMTRLIEAEAELNPSPAAFRALRDCGQDPDMLLEGLRDKRKELLISQQQLISLQLENLKVQETLDTIIYQAWEDSEGETFHNLIVYTGSIFF
jgi:hypothetical protein